MEDDYDEFVNKYVSIQRNATKKRESQEKYDKTEYDRKKEELESNKNSTESTE